MVDIHSTDDEQIAELKKVWRDHGRSIVLGVVLGVIVIVGWKFWQNYKLDHARAASAAYFQLDQAIANGDQAAIDNAQLDLSENYASTPYMANAKLATAARSAKAGDYQSAEDGLQWVAKNAKQKELAMLASLRLASVFNAQGKYEAALAQLSSANFATSFDGLTSEARGDALRGLGRTSEAREAYDAALASPGGASVESIQWKRDSLGEAAVEQESGEKS